MNWPFHLYTIHPSLIYISSHGINFIDYEVKYSELANSFYYSFEGDGDGDDDEKMSNPADLFACE